MLDLISKGGVKGIAHVTGGGFTDNIPRVFPKGLGAVIYKDSWEVPSVFKWVQEVRIAVELDWLNSNEHDFLFFILAIIGLCSGNTSSDHASG